MHVHTALLNFISRSQAPGEGGLDEEVEERERGEAPPADKETLLLATANMQVRVK